MRRGENDKAAVGKEAREATMRKWQKEWDTTEKGRWTRRLIAVLQT